MARPFTVSLVAALLIVFGLFGLTRITIEEDITALLPSKSTEQGTLIALSRQSGIMEKVVVLLGPDEGDPSKRHKTAEAIATALASLPGIRSAITRVDDSGMKTAAEVIFGSAANLYRPPETPLTAEAIRARLKNLRGRLSAPEAMMMQPFLLADPLGFATDSLKELEASKDSMGTAIHEGRLVSKDLRYSLILLEIDFNPLDISRSEPFANLLNHTIRKVLAAENQNTLPFMEIGGIHYVLSSAKSIRWDIQFAFSLTIFLVGIIFWVFFRRLRLLFFAMIPGLLGMATALGVFGLFHTRVHASRGCALS